MVEPLIRCFLVKAFPVRQQFIYLMNHSIACMQLSLSFLAICDSVMCVLGTICFCIKWRDPCRYNQWFLFSSDENYIFRSLLSMKFFPCRSFFFFFYEIRVIAKHKAT